MHYRSLYIPIGEEDEPTRIRKILNLRRSTALLIGFIIFYITFLVIGGCTFALLEEPMEKDIKITLTQSISRFHENYPSVSYEALEDLIDAIVQANNRGVSASRNVSGESNWSFGQSLFFSSTVVTTIGYGHVTPLSKEGKLFCIVYAMMGIPLTLILISAIVERLMVPTTMLLQYLNSKLGHLYQPFNIRLVHLGIVVLSLLIILFLIPASIFAYLEPGWDFLDSLYYCFISLTTIGLGDYIPGDSPMQPMRPIYKLATTVYLLIGLILMMLALSVFYDIPQLNLGMLFTMRSDEVTSSDMEKVRLQAPGIVPTKYGPDMSSTESTGSRPAIVRVFKSRRDDSPSPEDTTPVHARR